MSMSEEIVQIANDILNKIRENWDSSAVIAGGFARDLFLELPIKDVDVWGTVPVGVKEVVSLFPEVTSVEYFDQTTDLRLKAVVKFCLDGITFDYVAVKEDQIPPGGSIMDTFDFGICQAEFVNRRMQFTQMFWDDVNNRTLTYNKTEANDNNLARIVETHLPRLRNKFPGHRVVGIDTPPSPSGKLSNPPTAVGGQYSRI